MAEQCTQKINNLLNKAAEIVSCGPDCQKQRSIDNIKQTYLNAQQNLLNAPIELDKAKMNYYLYANPDGYELLEEEINEEAKNSIENIELEFRKLVSYTKEKNEVYNNLLENAKNTKELYLTYLEENDALEKELKDLTGDTITNDRKTYYQNQGITTLDDWYNLMKWVFYFIMILIAFYLFLTRNNLSLLVKLIILLSLFFYPFLVSYFFPSVSTMYDKHEMKKMLPTTDVLF